MLLPPCGGLEEYAAVDEVGDVAVGRILRAFGELRPLRRGELALEPVDQSAQDVPLPVVERLAAVRRPEPGLRPHGRQGRLRALEGTVEAVEEPGNPGGDLQGALLGPLEDLVIALALDPDLGRHAVEALRSLIRAREGQVGDGAGDPPVAVVEGVDRHEPEVCEGGLEDGIDRRRPFEPAEESRHLQIDPAGLRGLEVDPFLADRPRDDLHRARAVVPPGADPDPVDAASSGGEQRRVPAEQSFSCERGPIVLRGVERHLDDALDVPVRRQEGADVHPQAAREGGSDLLPVEGLSLDLARLEDVLGERVERGLLAEPEAEAFHPPDEPPLPMPHCGEPIRDPGPVPAEPGPIGLPVDVQGYSPHRMRKS